MSADDIRMMHADILTAAIAAAERREDGHIDETSLLAEVEKRLVFDIDKARKNYAKGILKRAQQPGSTAAVGFIQPSFPGFEHVAPRAYYPEQLIADEHGNLIEQDSAPLDTEAAKLGRTRENAKRVNEDLKLREAIHQQFERWVLAESRTGRAKRELTFGAFIRETGIWKAEVSTQDKAA